MQLIRAMYTYPYQQPLFFQVCRFSPYDFCPELRVFVPYLLAFSSNHLFESNKEIRQTE